MSRIAPVSPEAAPDRTRQALELVAGMFGRVPEAVSVTAVSPAIPEGYLGFERALRRADALDPRSKELAVLKAARLMGCPFCIDFGTFVGRQLGLAEEQLAELADHERSNAFTEEERAILDYAAAMSRQPPEVPEALFERLSSHFTERQIVELTAAIAWENYRSRFNKALGIASQSFAGGGA